jgi:hypothetical protein
MSTKPLRTANPRPRLSLDLTGNLRGVFHHTRVRKSVHTIAAPFNPRLPLRIRERAIWCIVCATIKLDHQACAVAQKVCNVWSHWRLAPKMRAIELNAPQQAP